jgi:DNA-binding transcriptional regulator YiaG
MAKFTHDQVRYIREQLEQGVKQDALAHEFNVCHGTISKIKLGKSFRRLL